MGKLNPIKDPINGLIRLVAGDESVHVVEDGEANAGCYGTLQKVQTQSFVQTAFQALILVNPRDRSPADWYTFQMINIFDNLYF